MSGYPSRPLVKRNGMETKPRILIIDDEEIVLDSCLQILEGSGYATRTASDGSVGLRQAAEFRPDLVFVDLKMPGISGFEVLERIRALDPSIVTIVITGYATLASAVEAMQKGAYDFLPKPFTPDEFRLITRRGIEKRELVLETIALRREKELLQENFAAIISHELRSPLSAVQQNLIRLTQELSDRVDEAQMARLERMKSRINDLLEMIHTWLRAISSDIGSIRENFGPTPIATVISRAVENVLPYAVRKDIDIDTLIAEPLDPVHGDEGTLVEAVVNLLGNAIRYSRSGSRVSVSAEQQADRILVAVQDSGIGIGEDELPYIFGDFYRGRAGAGDQAGAGLGLAITRRIVEAHGGTIAVTSKMGEGSTFVVALPVQDRGMETHQTPDAGGPENPQGGRVT